MTQLEGVLKRSARWEKAVTILLYSIMIAIWFGPAWLYRLTLKSTAWMWWPLAFLSSPPELATNPDWFYAQRAETKLARLLRPSAYVTIVAFVGISLWRTLNDGRLPDNKFLSVVGYAFSIDWVTVPWQLMAVSGAILSLTIVYLADWNLRKYRIAKETNDGRLADEAVRHFSWLESLARVRTLLFVLYCAIVASHAVLVFNASSCWFVVPTNVQRWAEWTYGSQYPQMQCERRQSRV